MDDVLKDLLLNGFLIYPNGGKFTVRKESIPTNNLLIPESNYDTYELALEAAINLLKTPKMLEWTIVVRYNRGLGIEYKNLPNVLSSTYEEAQILAEKSANKLLNDPNITISEIRVRLKN
jgi:hypothetical protein